MSLWFETFLIWSQYSWISWGLIFRLKISLKCTMNIISSNLILKTFALCFCLDDLHSTISEVLSFSTANVLLSTVPKYMLFALYISYWYMGISTYVKYSLIVYVILLFLIICHYIMCFSIFVIEIKLFYIWIAVSSFKSFHVDWNTTFCFFTLYLFIFTS